MTDSCGRHRLLSKTCGECRIIADEIRQNDFDRVSCFEENVMGFIHYAHTTLAQAHFQFIATIEDRFARN
jgi:hypothetical protein